MATPLRRAMSLAAFTLLFSAMPLFAHHGRDFLLLESPELPHPGAFYLVTSEHFFTTGGESEFEEEPAFLVGLSQSWAAEIHAHVAKVEGSSFHLEAVAPTIHYRVWGDETWGVAVSAEYEIARHRDEADTVVARGVVARAIGDGMLAFNVEWDREVRHGDSSFAAFALGYRPDLEARWSWGIEARGATHHAEPNEVVLGLYGNVADWLSVKAGAGTGFGSGRPDFVLRTGFVIRFSAGR
ncbi:MAG TPA: hypothetical protein VIY96_08935 [Thermoanaerobaculia bacterium]